MPYEGFRILLTSDVGFYSKESYRRSRMIDEATTDEDKVAPGYKVEEICELLRSPHVSIVREISEIILKRLDHESPIVKQKGQPDPLKGDALNKAVRDTANEAISAIFSTDDNKPDPAEDLYKRVQGFGNAKFEMPSEDEKSFFK